MTMKLIPATAPTQAPIRIIERAERDLAAATAMLAALRSYIVAAGEASESDDVDQLSCSLQSLFDVAMETVERSRESVRALVGVPIGTVIPIREGGDE